MPLCKTKDREGHTGIGITVEIADLDLRKMSAGQVFEALAAEYWSDFIRLSGAPEEDLDRTYNRSFLDKASLVLH